MSKIDPTTNREIREPLHRPIVIDAEALNPEQRAVYEAILSGPRGIVEGPLRTWLLSPTLADRAQALGEFCRYHTTLPPALSELAIVIVGSHWRAGFEWHVHAPIALGAGIDAVAIEAIRKGEQPALDGVQQIVYRFTRELLLCHAVADATYEAAVAKLGQQGVVELVGVIGYYTLICMTIKAFLVPIPDGAKGPFETGGCSAGR